MKRTLLMIVSLWLTLSLQAQVSKSVAVTAGSLSTTLTATELSTVTNLTLTGTIDARDFKTMRDNMPVLAVLDLSGTAIAAYTGTEGTYGTSSTVYPVNTVPDYAFHNRSTWQGKTSLISVVLPSSITSIGSNAFKNCHGLTSVILPSLVTSIGDLAFYSCNGLTSISIPSSVTSIGVQSFSYCYKLTSVAIPSSVTSIGNSAFLGSAGSITVDINNPNYSSLDGILFNKAQSTLIQCLTSKSGSYNIPSTVTSIGMEAFVNCSGLTSVVIPSSVTSIGSSAFSYCTGLTSVTIPASVTTIGGNAFVGSSGLKTIDTNNLNYSDLDGVLFDKAKTALIHCPVSKTGSFVIPSSVTSIESWAFHRCTQITTITIPSSVTSIGSYAFNGCTGLTTVTIPSSVTSIEGGTFWGCTGLTSVTIPSTVTSIGSRAFYNCSSLAKIYAMEASPVNLSSSTDVFYNVNKATCTLYIPSGTKALYTAASQWKDFANIVEMAEFKLSTTTATIAAAGGTATSNLTTALAWSASSNQTWLTFNPDSGTGNQTFTLTATANASIATRIASVTITTVGIPSQTIIVTQTGAPKNLAVTPGGLATALTNTELGTITKLILTGTIDARDFKTMRDNMPTLASVDLSGVTVAAYTGTDGTQGTSNTTYPANTVPTNAYYNSSTYAGKVNFKTIVLPPSITSIGSKAFYNCTGLNAVNIPSLVTSIGLQAFSNCTALITVDAANPNFSAIEGVLFNKPQTTLIQCPVSKTGSYTIPSSVVSIGTYAFEDCSGLTALAIPSSVTTIESGAFTSCIGLTTMTIPSSVTSLGGWAFQVCSGLNSVNIPSSVTKIERGTFYYCSKLTTVTIPSSVTFIGSLAFQDCSGLTTIYALALSPVNLNSSTDALYNINKTTCTLYVPYGTKSLYAAASQWKDFTNIVEMAEFKLSANKANIVAAGGTTSVDLTTALSWTASSDQTWLTINSLSGTGNQTFTLTATSNATVANRLATLTVSSVGIPSQTIIVTQVGVPKASAVTAGELATVLTATELGTITKLILTGTIDARDFKTMRDNMPLLAEVDLRGVTIAAYTGTEGTNGTNNISYPANTVPDYANYNSSTGTGKTSMTSCALPSSVISIGNYAFYFCTGLTSIAIPLSVTSIADRAFSYCTAFISVDVNNPNYSSLDGVLFNKVQTTLLVCPISKTGSYTIPSSVVSIQQIAFSGCNVLNSVIISSSVKSIDYATFWGCSGLTSVIIPSSVTSIGNSVFQYCSSLTSVTIPSSVTSIGTQAFYNCSSLTKIYALAASPVNLNTSTDVFFNVSKATCTLYVPYGTKALYMAAIQWKDFANIVEMAEFKLSATAATLAQAGGTASFNLTTGLTWTASSDQTWLSVNSLSGTGNQTFTLTASANSSVATRLVTVTITTAGIPSQTFILTQPGVPKTSAVTAGELATVLTATELGTITKLILTGTIDARDFKTMRDLMPLLAGIDLSWVTVAAYTGTEGTASTNNISYPANTIPESAFSTPVYQGINTGKTSLTSLVLPSSINSIGNYAFRYCSGLASIVLPSSITLIGIQAFYFCTGMESITIPLSVTSIADRAFSYCTALLSVDENNPNFSGKDGVLFNKVQTTLIVCSISKTGSYTIPTTIATIKELAFEGCSKLTSLVIPSSVKTIEYASFWGCSKITSVIIPSSVNSISLNAFAYCDRLTSIIVGWSVPVDLTSSPEVFKNVNLTACTLKVPYGTKALYSAANQWKDFTNIVEMAEFKLSATTANVAASAGSIATVNLTTALAWTASSDQTWLTVNALSGTGNKSFAFTATANASYFPRSAIVTVSTTDIASQTIVITQSAINTPLTGIKTINPVGGDFLSFTEAITALNANGVGTGGVIFMVASGTNYHEAELIIQTTTSNASNPVAFRKDGNGANPIIYGKKVAGTSSDAIVRINGSDYITFDGIDLASDPAASTDADKIEMGYSIASANNTNGCNYLIIKNCNITIDRKTIEDNQYGINFYQSASMADGIHSNILIENVKFVKGRTAFFMNASNASLPNENVEIRNCKFGESATTIEPLDYKELIGIINCKNLSFHNNEIQNIVGPDFYALKTTLTGNNSIFSNKIHNVRSTSTIEESDLWAIYATSGIGTTTNIYNNLIYDLDGAKSSSTLGTNTYWNLQIIQLAGAGTSNVYNNTVVGSSVNPHENTIFCWPSATTELRNNIFADFSITGSNSVRSFFNTVCIVENNLFWMDELLSNNYTYNSTYKFREWQKGSSKPSAGNYLTNIFDNPNFTDRAKFDFSLKNPSLASNNGQPIGFITTDINGMARDGVKPDIGAIEGDFGPAADLIPPLIRFQPIPSNLLDVVKLTAEITDNVKVADSKLWYRDKSSNSAFLQIQGSQYGNIWEFTFPALSPGNYEYFVCAKDASGNVISNGFMTAGLNEGLTGLTVNNPPANPDYAYSFANKKTFGGAEYTVGTGGNYASLTRPGGLFDAINSSLVAENMSVTILSDLDETGEIALKQWQENGNGNYTLTIKPGNATLKTISNSTINPITILGADRVIIDGSFNGDNLNHLKFSCDYANPVKFNSLDTNGCDNISIKYCDFSSISYTCIFVTGSNHSNFSVDHVNAIKGYSGVSLNNVKNASITNCTIGNTDVSKPMTNYGVYLAGCSNILVENNTIRNIINSTANASAMGIFISTVSGGTISRNKILNVLNSSTAGNCVSNGLLGVTCSNMILSNNIISGVNGTGHATLEYNFGIKGLVLTGCNYMKLYYNTVNLYGEGNAATNAESFVLSTDNSANLEIRNNIFSNTIFSSNTASWSELVYQKSTELTNVFTNNLYYNGGTNSYAEAFYIAGNWPDFRGWQSFGFAPGNGRDLGGGYGDPKFTNPGSGDFSLLALSPGLNSGIPVSVTTDFNGNPRSSTSPEMGAIENNSLAITTDIIAPVIDYSPFQSSLNTTPAFSATITDNVAVTAAKLWYRKRGSIDAFASVDGVKQTNNLTWNFTIISALTSGAGYEYFICAKDAANNIITNGITTSVLNTATVGLANNSPAANPAYFRSFSVADLSITLGTITGSPFFVSDIQSASTEIPFTKNGMFSSGNVITAYLSDANGNFTSEKAIGDVTSGSENVYEGDYRSVGFRIHPSLGILPVDTQLKFTAVNANTVHKTQVGEYTGFGLDITVTDQTMIVGGQTVNKCNLQVTGMPNPADQTVYDSYNGAPMNYYNPVTKVFELYFAYNNAAPRKIRETNTMVNLGKLIGVFNNTIPAGTGYKIRVKSSQPAGIVSNSSNAFEIRKTDQTPPIITLSSNKTSPVFAPFTVTIAFNEEVQNFAIDMITAINATLGNFSAEIPNKQFTVLVTPVNTGNVSIQVEASKVVDLAANPNGPSNKISLSYIELDAPYLNITSLVGSDTIRISPSKLKFTFSQDVTGFSAGDIVATNGSISNLVADGTFPNKIFTADLTPILQGLVKITVADDVAVNSALKGNSAASFSLIYAKHAIAPKAVVKKTSTAPVVDGTIDAVWANANTYNITVPHGTPTLGQPGTTTWKALWNNDGIYVLLQVNDDLFYPAYAATPPGLDWMYDRPEIYFDVNQLLADAQGPVSGNGHYQFAPGFVESQINKGAFTGWDGSTYAFSVTSPTYVAEYFIPFTKLLDKDGIQVPKINKIGFEVIILDKDSEAINRMSAGWSSDGSNGGAWNNMDGCGTITLESAEAGTLVSSIAIATAGGAATIETSGGTLQMSASILPVNATNPNVQWMVTNGTGKAIIDSNGLLSAYSNGTVTVIAKSTDGSYITASKLITISNQPVTPPDAATMVFSIIGNAFFLPDGVTNANWGYDIDLTFVGTTDNVSSYRINNLELLTNGEFKIRKDHQWNESYGYSDVTITGDPSNFTEIGENQNIKVLTGKGYDITLMVNWATNSCTIAFDGQSPTVHTAAVTEITATSVTAGGEVINPGSSQVTARGVCWSTTANPTVALTTKTTNGSGNGVYASNITGLTAATTYHVRAYATTSMGTYYGSDVTFTTSSNPTHHFVPIWTGNGVDHMNINIFSAQLDGVELEAGDEIGIFDGTICVGVGTLTGPVTSLNTLDIAVSKNDGSGNGYTSGNTISYKLFDKSKDLEMNNVTAIYSNTDPSWSTDGKFAIGATAFVELTGLTKVNQDIVLNTGWNIISANIIPVNLNLKDLFQTLIDAGKLKKVMDEAGKTIENFGAFGGWKNNIGNLNSAKGYKVNVLSTSTLSLEGTPVLLPLDIALATGWNIISYPSATAQEAKALVQSLIDTGKLKKVMDEAGKTIENFGAFGGWKNNIGNLLPGKGYKVNVLENCILIIPAEGTKSAIVIPELLASEYFKPVFSGNGTDHASINLVNLQASGLLVGDEIGLFDGKLCVGSATIGSEQMMSGSISIPASANDGLGESPNGFVVGNRVSVKLYRNGQTYPLTLTKLEGQDIFDKNASLFAQVSMAEATGITGFDNETGIRCYPNPFSEQITIEIQSDSSEKLEVNIYTMDGKLVRKLYKDEMKNRGILVWDGRNETGIRVVPGTYLIKANDRIEKVVFME